jgi:hypothetical protein
MQNRVLVTKPLGMILQRLTSAATPLGDIFE